MSDAELIKLDVLPASALRQDEIQAWIDDLDPLDDDEVSDVAPAVHHNKGTPANVNQIVHEYLIRKGYTNTASILKSDSSAELKRKKEFS